MQSKPRVAFLLAGLILVAWYYFAMGPRGEISGLTDLAKQRLVQDVEIPSNWNIKVVRFNKRDGQSSEFGGVKSYKLDFTAEISFESDGTWQSGGLNDEGKGLSFKFSPSQATGTQRANLNNFLEGGKPVGKDYRAIIRGVMIGVKSENGWTFSRSDTTLLGGPGKL